MSETTDISVVTIKNISRSRLKIYVEPDSTSLYPLVSGWVGINPGYCVTVDADRVNDGWLYTLYTDGAVKLDYIDITV